MRFSLSTALALLSAPLLALAQQPNAFTLSAGFSATGGKPVDLTWNPTTQGTISLILRSGNAANLAEGTIIASKISNSGSYTWTPDNSLTRGSDYAIEIVSDDNPDQQNYSPRFVLDTPTTETHTTSTVTLGAPSSGALPTGSATSASTTASAVTATGPGGVPLHNTFTNLATRTTASTGTASGASSSMATSASGSGSTGQNLGASSSSSAGGAAKATAMAGMLGAVALGALAL